MADQFCRIVDTTLTDSTLGSDATQSVITTDASTSFVIRDIYKTDNCTSSTFNYKLDLELDGHKVHKDLENTASGTFIVPPSSTLCVKDTTGNYPLRYKDLSTTLYRFCNDAATGCNWTCLDYGGAQGTCTQGAIEDVVIASINGVEDHTPSTCCVFSCCTASCCNIPICNCICNFGTARTEWNRCWTVYTMEGRETNCRQARIVRASDGCIVGQLQGLCHNYLHQDGMLLWNCANNCRRIYDLRQACSSFSCASPHRHWCVSGQHCATYCCGSATLSTPHKGCWACRVVTSVCSQGSCAIYFNIFNICNCCSCTFLARPSAEAGLASCLGYSQYLAMGSIWDEDYNTWIGVAYGRSSYGDNDTYNRIVTWRSCDCACCVLCTETSFEKSFCYARACFFNEKLHFTPTCSADYLDSINSLYEFDLRGYALGTCTSCEPQLLLSNFFCNTCCMYGMPYCANNFDTSASDISSRTYSIAPNSKLTVYGIKST